jgi:hypothetical protein
MSESLRNDGRVWAPKTKEVAEKLQQKRDNCRPGKRGRARLLPGKKISIIW